MNIALVIERMDVGRGGRETSTSQIAAELVTRGHAVTILCQSGSWAYPGVTLRALGRRGFWRTTKLANFIADVQRETETGFDVVHAMLPLPGADVVQLRGGTIPAQRRASRRRRGFLYRLFSPVTEPLNAHRQAMAKLETQVASDPGTRLLPVSDMVAREVADDYDRTEGVRTVYNGVDVPDIPSELRVQWRSTLRQRLGVGDADAVFVTVATNFRLKGVRQAILAFARWVQRSGANARLVVVGRDPVTADGYRRLAGAHGLGRRVFFEAPTEEIFQLYSAADACVLLSWYDPCSRVVLEAARWGLPSITTGFNGAAEVLGDSAGIVVETPNDIDAVADAMEQLADPAVRVRAAQACVAMGDRLTMGRHVDQLLDVYDEVKRR